MKLYHKIMDVQITTCASSILKSYLSFSCSFAKTPQKQLFCFPPPTSFSSLINYPTPIRRLRSSSRPPADVEPDTATWQSKGSLKAGRKIPKQSDSGQEDKTQWHNRYCFSLPRANSSFYMSILSRVLKRAHRKETTMMRKRRKK